MQFNILQLVEKLENLYKIAQQDLNEQGEDEKILAFKLKYKLESGFYKKPIEFFYWLYLKENEKISKDIFQTAFIGRMIKFDKKNIPNYMELVLEYEKENYYRKKRNNTFSKKAKIKRLSETGQD